MEADRYAGIVTVTAVVLAVIYADGDYDIWDAALGMLVVVLSLKYRAGIERDRLSSFLSAFLFSLGVAVVVFTALPFLPLSDKLAKWAAWKYRVLDAQFMFVLITTIPLAAVWHALSHNKKVQPVADADG